MERPSDDEDNASEDDCHEEEKTEKNLIMLHHRSLSQELRKNGTPNTTVVTGSKDRSDSFLSFAKNLVEMKVDPLFKVQSEKAALGGWRAYDEVKGVDLASLVRIDDESPLYKSCKPLIYSLLQVHQDVEGLALMCSSKDLSSAETMVLSCMNQILLWHIAITANSLNNVMEQTMEILESSSTTDQATSTKINWSSMENAWKALAASSVSLLASLGLEITLGENFLLQFLAGPSVEGRIKALMAGQLVQILSVISRHLKFFLPTSLAPLIDFITVHVDPDEAGPRISSKLPDPPFNFHYTTILGWETPKQLDARLRRIQETPMNDEDLQTIGFVADLACATDDPYLTSVWKDLGMRRFATNTQLTYDSNWLLSSTSWRHWGESLDPVSYS